FTCLVPEGITHLEPPLALLAVSEHGLIARAPLDVQDPAPAVLTDIVALMRVVFPPHRATRAMLDRHVGPAIEALWETRRRDPEQPVETLTVGTPPANPDLSIIVPIYGRWDFIEYQLALFR